jgi:hypothetical protein
MVTSSKHTLIAIAVLSGLVSVSAQASHVTQVAPAYKDTQTFDDSNLRLAIPNLKSGFEVNVSALWLKPGASNLNYDILNKELPAQSPSWSEQELTPSYAPAFELGLRYIFPNSGEDVTLDWTHLYSSTGTSVAAVNDNFFLGPDFEIGPEGTVIRNASGNVKFRYDVVNLDAGQFISFGRHVDMRFFGGLSTGFLREEVTATYTGTITGIFGGPFRTTQDSKSNFTGVGPRIGLHVDFNTDYGFGFLGEAAASALIGNVDSQVGYNSSAPELLSIFGQSINNQTIKDQHVYQVVPGFDAKLGVNYKYAFNNMLFTVAAGYQASVYVNAISQYHPGSLVAGQPLSTGGIFVATMNHTLSNYSVQGPFLNFALQF